MAISPHPETVPSQRQDAAALSATAGVSSAAHAHATDHTKPWLLVFTEHRAMLWVLVAQFTVSWALCNAAGRPLIVGFADASETILGAVLLFGLMALAVALVRLREDSVPLHRAYADAWTRLRRETLTPTWIVSVLLTLIALQLSLDVFSSAKRAIPSVYPFSWDATLDHADVWLHAGRRPWVWLQPLLAHPAITAFADEYYHRGWTVLVLGVQAIVALSPPSLIRRRYLTASLLVWFVVGTLGALTFSSAGPPYYHHVVSGADPYAGLFAYLRSVDQRTPLLAVGGQRALWGAYLDRANRFGFGVSAMPSVHVASATLLACLGFARARWLGVLLTIGALLTFVCSIALGWHYAVDGYVAALLAVVLWFFAGRLERLAATGQ